MQLYSAFSALISSSSDLQKAKSRKSIQSLEVITVLIDHMIISREDTIIQCF